MNQPCVEFVRFTKEQEHAFNLDPNLLRFFCKLAIEGFTPDEVSKEWKLSSKETTNFLRNLENLGMIRSNGNLVHVQFPKMPLFEDSLQSVRKLKLDAAQEIISFVTQNSWDKDAFRLSYLPLVESSRAELVAALSALIEDFARRSQRESTLHGSKKLQATTLVSLVVPKGCTPSFCRA